MFRISFTLENDNTILWWIYRRVHLYCQWERRVIHIKIVYNIITCFTQVYAYGIAYFPFHSGFHSVPFSVLRFRNTRYQYTLMCEDINVYNHIICQTDVLQCSYINVSLFFCYSFHLFLLCFLIIIWKFEKGGGEGGMRLKVLVCCILT